MPEGPEIRLAADRLHAVLAGHTIEDAEFTLAGMQAAAGRVRGKQVEQVSCHGKAMLTQFSHGETLYSHNQLYGVWRIVKRGQLPSTNRQLRVALHTSKHSALLFSATDVEFWPTEFLSEHPFLKKLGPDVLDETLTKSIIVSRLKSEAFSRRSLASLYLDQGFIAGIGNYLRTEILFKAKLAPRARPIDLSKAELDRLARATLSISQRSYRTRGITVSQSIARQLKQRGGGFETYRFAAFGRKGKPCVICTSKIVREDIGARRLYSCPRCQEPSAP